MQVEADSGDVDSDHQSAGRDEANKRVRWIINYSDDPLPYNIVSLCHCTVKTGGC